MSQFPLRIDRRKLAAIATALVALLSALGLVVVDDGTTPPAPAPIATPVMHELGGPGHATVPAAAPTPVAALETDLTESAPPTPAAARRADQLKPDGQPTIPARIPLAAANTPGCKTALVRNYSSRGGAPVLLFVMHWTGSAVTPGWAGVDGNLRWFDTPAAQASSTYLTDSWGNCALAVPESQTPWTQAAFNRWSISVEVVNPGVLPLFRSDAGRDRVVDLLIGAHKRWGIPLQVAKTHCTGPRTGVVDRPGVLAHRDLGACGGGHPDVGNGGDVATLIAAAKAKLNAQRVTAVDRVTCRKLNWWRNHGRKPGLGLKRAIRRRDALTNRGVRCLATGPVRLAK